MIYVGVIGTGEEVEPFVNYAREVGELLAEKGACVICGGLGGVMNAVAEGCRSRSGICIGILPGETRSGASWNLTVSIPTGLGEGRNFLIVRASDVLIAIGGGFGTLSEIALALKIGKPVVGLSTWEGKSIEQELAIVKANSPADAVKKALAGSGLEL